MKAVKSPMNCFCLLGFHLRTAKIIHMKHIGKMSIKCGLFFMKAVKSPKNCVFFRIPSSYGENNTYEASRQDIDKVPIFLDESC